MNEQTDTVNVRLPRSTWEAVKALADREGRSGTVQLDRSLRDSPAIREWLAARPEPGA